MIRTIPRSKVALSRWILFFFALTLLLSGIGSVFFQAPATTNQELNKYRSLFSAQDVAEIQELTLTNRLGEFTFDKVSDGKRWKMSSPRSVMANSVPLNRMLSTLQNLKIKRIFERDPINISNFSLENPLITINFKKESGESRKLLFGLLNPIDNSTYLMFEKGEAIYHVDAVDFTLESLDLASFIDSRIFPIQASEIKSFKIFKGNNTGRPQLSLTQKEDQRWFDRDDNALEPLKVQEYIKELNSLRSLFIIDKKTPELKKAIDAYLGNAFYTIEVKDSSDEVYTYTLSYVINSLPQIKIESKQNFIVQASSRDYPFLLDKEALKLFNKRDNSFKKLGIDELFY